MNEAPTTEDVVRGSHIITGTGSVGTDHDSSTVTETPATIQVIPLPLPPPVASSSPLSVTIITQNVLPSYSSERFYLLSEIEVHAASTIFLTRSSFNEDVDDDDDQSTQATEDESCQNNIVNNNNSDDTHQDLHMDNDDHDHVHGATNQPEPNECTDINETSQIRTHQNQPPLFLILYILWKPTMTTDPQLFIQDTILAAITQIQEQYGVDITQSRKIIQNLLSQRNNHHSTSVLSDSNETTPPSQQQQHRPSASVYIVVDRVVPRINSSRETATPTTTTVEDEHGETLLQPPTESDDNQEEQYRLVESVGRAVASHARLRDVIDGITIGLSDHVRAAPGLECGIDAITKIGHIDRRRYKFNPNTTTNVNNNSNTSGNNNNNNGVNVKTSRSSPVAVSNGHANNHSELESAAKKSLLSVVAMSKDDLIGLQDITNTDAADSVQQSTVTAEWFGQGDIYMFASRAHFVWKQRYNVRTDSDHAMNGNSGTVLPTSDPFFRKRKLPRRISSPHNRTLSSSTRTIQHRHGYRMTIQQERQLLDDIYDVLGYVWILTFIMYHFIKLDLTVVVSTYDTILSILQSIIRMWIDLIRSARGW